MKNFSGITDNLDITTKKYVDDGLAEKANSSDLATVATSGSYNDLANKLTAGSNISISGNTISATVPTNYVTTDTEQTITSKKTFNGEVKFGSTENFQGYYIKRMIGSLGAGTRYADLDSSYKDGTWHRMWRLRFPSGSSFWGKIKITLYGGYSSFNASGVMSKSITCNFNTSSIYNNVGCYDGLGVNVEQDFRISEAIWNATASAWEVLIWQKNLSGNNSPTIMLECWTTNNTNYINAFNGITAQPVELTQSTSYSAQKASPTGGTKTVEWATLPVYENPLGEEIATIGDLSNKANLSGGNTFTGKQTLNSPGSDGYSINAAGYVKGSWLQASAIANKGANTGKVCVFDNSGWIYYRTPAEILAEAGGAKASDIPTDYVTTNTDQYDMTGNKGWTGNDGTISIHRGSMTFSAKSGDTYGTAGFDVNNAGDNSCGGWSVDENTAHLCLGVDGACDIQLNENAGTSGQVLTSQGPGNTPIWTTPSGGGGATDAVKYTAQTLTASQKSQARSNIGAGTGNGTVTGVKINGSTKGTSGVVDLGYIQVKLNGTTYTADSSGFIDLGTISGGGTVYASIYNDIY